MEDNNEMDIEAKPKINNYMQDIKAPVHESEHEAETTTEQKHNMEEDLDPTAEAPMAAPETEDRPEPSTEIKERMGGQTIGQVKHMEQQTPQRPTSLPPTPPPPIRTSKNSPNPQRKKMLIKIFGIFFGVIAVLLVASFIYVMGAGEEPGIFARIFGVEQAIAVNWFIGFIMLLFFIISIALFALTMFALIKLGKTPKEDIEMKKKGKKFVIIMGSVLFLYLIIWMISFVYLDTKRMIPEKDRLLDITTEPVDTVNLTAPVTIKFDASNIKVPASGFRIISYNWDFGDGKTGTGQLVSHLYENKGKNGRFDVTLEVTFRNDKTGEELPGEYGRVVTIGNQALSAVFKAKPMLGDAPLKVEFDASDSTDPDGIIEEYKWDMDGDGEFDDEEGIKVEYEFKEAGDYMVGLEVTSTTGETATSEQEIGVKEADLPEAVIGISGSPETLLTNEEYTFKADDSSSPNGKITKYEWDFGDGTDTETTKNTSHSYTKSGIYTITLTVTDEDDKKGKTTKEMTVGAAKGIPKAAIETDPASTGGTISGEAPFTVVFDASGSTDPDKNIVDYEWDFNGDGTIDKYGAVVSYTFEQKGNYTAAVTVLDADDNQAKAEISVKVAQQGMTANIKTDKVDGNVPLTVSFDASGSSYQGGNITSYRWNFGDGTSPKLGEAQISHKYTSIGTYTASVEVIADDNTTKKAEVLITVREIPLTACFTSVFNEGPAPFENSFDPSCSTGTINSYFWDFGDGNTSTDLKPQHIFTNAGTYTVTLEISDNENTVSSSSLVVKAT
jgi:PKD repeat protein